MRKLTALAIVIIALVAWVLVPDILQGMHRSNQKRSMADIRTIAVALESRATDMKTYAVGAKHRDVEVKKSLDWGALTPIPAESLRRALELTYVRAMPMNDAWGRPFEFAAGDQSYAIRSFERDGRADTNGIYKVGITNSFDADLVFANGSWIHFPDGI
jgi:type II secretory pathway pseudopilin PulG